MSPLPNWQRVQSVDEDGRLYTAVRDVNTVLITKEQAMLRAMEEMKRARNERSREEMAHIRAQLAARKEIKLPTAEEYAYELREYIRELDEERERLEERIGDIEVERARYELDLAGLAE